ncbi:hypothetical protein NBRC10512v2_006512 [Rhodotorula toruloides]|uniref:RHTO0S11e03048g1_1 n=2 Tax=Rhodotorula toruloides TaxID=5286 RepID=A0A061B6W7_RHOTO|nr:uncharacterized protein RHTO_01730 [Rhodotorula toruloides NP11]EMS21670.1 hypothetical protein RHTO_01730 [Rhodotorula toruloides NP11]CDR45657.1 RHTO0S11e03048g1_1 [Rhodotorula toruloides]
MASEQGASRRRSSLLAFKGPAQPKRERKKTVLIDPIVPRRASLEGKGAQKGVKRRRSSGASDGDKVDVKRVVKEKRDKGKKRAQAERDEEQDEEDPSDADTPSIRSYTRTVPRTVLAARWTTLSSSAREDLRYEVEQAGRSTLDTLGSHSSSSAQNLKALFSSFADDLDTLLSTLPVPPLPSSISSSSKNGKGKQVLLGAKFEEGEMERKISLLETALEAEQADVDALSSRVEDERRLLKKEEKLLEQFIKATTEARDGIKEDLERKSAHPLVSSLLPTRPSASTFSSASLLVPGLVPSALFTFAPKLSSAWFAEPLTASNTNRSGKRTAKRKGKKRIKTSLESVEARESDDEEVEEAHEAGSAATLASASVVERVEEVLRRLGRAEDAVVGGEAGGSGGQKGKERRKVSE